MAPTSRIYLTRHSQAEHNVADDYSIPDAPLTALGKQQSARLAALTLELQENVELILSSALKRTLQSTKIGYAPAIQRLGGLGNVVLLPQLQECNDYPCDTGSPRHVLEADPELRGFDFSPLTPDWDSKQGFYASDDVSLDARAQWVRQYIRSRPENEILIMAHGDILRRITGQQYPWKNAQVRLFEFDPDTVNSEAAPLRHVRDIASCGSDTALSPTENENENEIDRKKQAELTRIEERLRHRQSVVLAQTSELQELERRLAEAERRKQELEARGIRI